MELAVWGVQFNVYSKDSVVYCLGLLTKVGVLYHFQFSYDHILRAMCIWLFLSYYVGTGMTCYRNTNM